MIGISGLLVAMHSDGDLPVSSANQPNDVGC